MAKAPTWPRTPPQGEAMVETPDGRSWTDGDKIRSNVYDNQDFFNLPSPNRTIKPQRRA